MAFRARKTLGRPDMHLYDVIYREDGGSVWKRKEWWYRNNGWLGREPPDRWECQT